MNVLFVVIARGGSKSVPRKNLCEIGGLPLIAYKTISALKSDYCSRAILSSEDSEIQHIGRKYGLDTPFTRPTELASDIASSDDVLCHSMAYVSKNDRKVYDAVMLLEPSTPFATQYHYNKAVELMIKNKASLVTGVCVHKINRCFIAPMDDSNRITCMINQFMDMDRLDRQAQMKDYTLNGAFYLLSWDYFKKYKNRYRDPRNSYGLIMDPYESVEIDEPIDLEWAQFLVENNHINLKHWKI